MKKYEEMRISITDKGLVMLKILEVLDTLNLPESVNTWDVAEKLIASGLTIHK